MSEHVHVDVEVLVYGGIEVQVPIYEGVEVSAPRGPRGFPGTPGVSAEVRHDNTGVYDYMGRAPVGTAESAPGWTITRITLASPPATGTATGAWTDRASLTYI